MFKYMSAEVGRLFAGTLRVRFTQPSGLNDPFELRPLIDFAATAEEFRKDIDAKITQIFGTPENALVEMEKRQAADPNFPKLPVSLGTIRLLIKANPAFEQQFLRDFQRFKAEAIGEMTKSIVWETFWERTQQTFGNLVGIFCMSEDGTNPLMWSHYAEAHNGIVVELDEEHRWFDQKVTPFDDMRHRVQVCYVQNPHPLTLKQLSGSNVLYTKNSEWAYEREWRIIRPLKDGIEVRPGIFCFDVPPDSIRSIVFGWRTAPNVEEEIRGAIAANPNLQHLRSRRARLIPGGKIEIVDADASSATA